MSRLSRLDRGCGGAVLGLLYVWFSSRTSCHTSSAIGKDRSQAHHGRALQPPWSGVLARETPEMSGSVKNTGTTVSRVVVETLWKDEFGLVVERGVSQWGRIRLWHRV